MPIYIGSKSGIASRQASRSPWEALCPLRPGCPLAHVCKAEDEMGLQPEGSAWGQEGWGPDPKETNSAEGAHPRVKGASGWGAPDKVRMPFPIQQDYPF